MSRLFGHVTKMLGIKHKTGAALNPRANGYAEQIIKRVNEGLRRYSLTHSLLRVTGCGS